MSKSEKLYRGFLIDSDDCLNYSAYSLPTVLIRLDVCPVLVSTL